MFVFAEPACTQHICFAELAHNQAFTLLSLHALSTYFAEPAHNQTLTLLSVHTFDMFYFAEPTYM